MREIENIKTIISELQQSPIFNMSLASKELFHSNFIAWILESDFNGKDGFITTLFPGISAKDLPIDKVDREVSNFDIRVWFNSKKNIVIENKVKSLPDAAQLRKYSAALEKKSDPSNTTCILLSLTAPDFFSLEGTYKTESNYDWYFVSYEMLTKSLKKLKPTDFYSEALIKDYIELTSCLCQLQKTCQQYWEDEAELINYHGSLYNETKRVRLHDIYEKWRMDALKQYLLGRYKNTFSDKVLTVDYSNESGLLNIDPIGANNAQKYLKLQIQGTQLRQVLQYKEGNPKIFEKAKIIMDASNWFCDTDGEALPDKQKRKNTDPNDRGFCKYSDYFAYRYETGWDIDRVIELTKNLKVLIG